MKKAVGLFFCLAVIAYFLSTQFVFMGSCSGDCYVWFEGNSFDWAYVCLSLKRDQWAHEMLFDGLIMAGKEPEPSYNERLVRDPLPMVKLTLHYDCRSTIWGTVRNI